MTVTTPDSKNYYDEKQLPLTLSEKEVAMLFVLMDYHYIEQPAEFPIDPHDERYHHLGFEKETYEILIAKLLNHAPIFLYWNTRYAGYESVIDAREPQFPKDPKLRIWYESGIDNAYRENPDIPPPNQSRRKSN